MKQHEHRHILVIDDSLDNQALLRILLESSGYTVECASNGAEALSLLASVRVLPDVILLDLRMPVMDGFEFLTSQNNSPALRNIPTVVMSADGDIESTRLRTKAPGQLRAPEVLMKPLSIVSVINAIEGSRYLH